MARKVLWPVLVIGILMIVMPFAISLPSKASAGQTMLNEFHPIMQPAAVRTAAKYYYQTFVPLGPVANGGVLAAPEIPKFVATLATELHMTPAQVQLFMGTDFPAMAKLLESFPQLLPIFANVPPGLAAYKPLLTAMQDNVHNYAQIDSLPSFNLFTWFFVIPGALIVLLAAYGLGAGKVFRRRRAGSRVSVET
jgi:hypothetical protein